MKLAPFTLFAFLTELHNSPPNTWRLCPRRGAIVAETAGEQAERLHINKKSLAVRKQEEAEHACDEAKKDLLGAGIRLWIVLGTLILIFSP